MLAVWIVAYLVCGIIAARCVRHWFDRRPKTLFVVCLCWPIFAFYAVLFGIAYGLVRLIQKLP